LPTDGTLLCIDDALGTVYWWYSLHFIWYAENTTPNVRQI